MKFDKKCCSEDEVVDKRTDIFFLICVGGSPFLLFFATQSSIYANMSCLILGENLHFVCGLGKNVRKIDVNYVTMIKFA